jgi:hypothetical protein
MQRNYSFAYLVLRLLGISGRIFGGLSVWLLLAALVELFQVLAQPHSHDTSNLSAFITFSLYVGVAGLVSGFTWVVIAELGLAVVDPALNSRELVELLKDRIPALPQASPVPVSRGESTLQKVSSDV